MESRFNFKHNRGRAFIITFSVYFVLLMLTFSAAIGSSSIDQSTRRLIISLVKNLSHLSFDDEDLIIRQNVESDFISYNLVFHNIPIFVQNTTKHKQKSVVILEDGENRLPPVQNEYKSVYVILKRTPDPSKSFYWPLFGYVRKSHDGTIPPTLELESWEDRNSRNLDSLLGWTNCSSPSIITPCKSDNNYNEEPTQQREDYAHHIEDFQTSKKYIDDYLQQNNSLCGDSKQRFRLQQYLSDIPSLMSYKEKHTLMSLLLETLAILRTTNRKDNHKICGIQPKNFPAERDQILDQAQFIFQKNILDEKLNELGQILTKTGLRLPQQNESLKEMAKSAVLSLVNIQSLSPEWIYTGFTHTEIDEQTLFNLPETSIKRIKRQIKSGMKFSIVKETGCAGEEEESYVFAESGGTSVYLPEGIYYITRGNLSIPAPPGTYYKEFTYTPFESENKKREVAERFKRQLTPGGTFAITKEAGCSGGKLETYVFTSTSGYQVLMPEGNYVVSESNMSTDPGTYYMYFTYNEDVGSEEQVVSFSVVPLAGEESTKKPHKLPTTLPTLPDPPPLAYLFFPNNNSADSESALITYVTNFGFLFFGCYFPGWVASYDQSSSTYTIDIGDHIFSAQPVDLNKLHRFGAYYPPIPTTSIVVNPLNGKKLSAYFLGHHYLINGKHFPGDEYLNDATKIELSGNNFPATLVSPAVVPTLPGELGAYRLELKDGHSYLAYVCGGGVLIGGIYIPAKMTPTTVTIEGERMFAQYMRYSVLRFQSDYSIGTMFASRENILKLYGHLDGIIDFSLMYVKGTGLQDPGKLDKIPEKAVEIECRPGHTGLSIKGGISPKLYDQIVFTDWDNEMLKEITRMKSHSSAKQGQDEITPNTIDWGGRLAVGDAPPENLIGGYWTPLGIAREGRGGDVAETGKNLLKNGFIEEIWSATSELAKDFGGTLVSSFPANGINKSIEIGKKTVGICWFIGLRYSDCEVRTDVLEEKKNFLNSLKKFYLENPPICENRRKKRSIKPTDSSLLERNEISGSPEVGKPQPDYYPIPIFGINLCSPSIDNLSRRNIDQLVTPKEIAFYYLALLSTNCILPVRENILELIDENHIKLTNSKTFFPVSLLKNNLKLKKYEMDILYRAVEISALSLTFIEFRNQETNYEFVENFGLQFVSLVHKHLPLHAIKLTRRLLKTLQSMLTKFYKEEYQFKYCKLFLPNKEKENEEFGIVRDLSLYQSNQRLVAFISTQEIFLSGEDSIFQVYSSWKNDHVGQLGKISTTEFHTC